MYDHYSHLTDEETKKRNGLSIQPKVAQLVSGKAGSQVQELASEPVS